jgi:hypothetical protein
MIATWFPITTPRSVNFPHLTETSTQTDQREGSVVAVWEAKPTHTGVGQCVHDNRRSAAWSRGARGRRVEGRIYYSEEASQFFTQPLESNERVPCVHQLTSDHWQDNIVLRVVFCEKQQLLNRKPAYLVTYKHCTKSVF